MMQRFLGLLVLLISVVAAWSVYRTYQASRHDPSARRDALNLVVFTHTSFMDSFGPGQDIKKLFENKYEGTIEYVDAGGAAMAIEKLILTPDRRVDVVLGLDLLFLERAAREVKFQELRFSGINLAEDLQKFSYLTFMPYDWSEMGFVYRKGEVKPATSWKEALDGFPKGSVSLEDPELSAPGLTFLYWAHATGEAINEFWAKWIPKLHSVSPSWSQAYGLFSKKQSKVTFSYLTSLVYHWEVEKDRRYDFMVFNEGQPLQIEYAAVPNNCWNCGMAKQFVRFLAQPEAQKVLMQKNFMRPVVAGMEAGTVYSQLPKVKHLPIETLNDFIHNQKEILDQWKKARQEL